MPGRIRDHREERSGTTARNFGPNLENGLQVRLALRASWPLRETTYRGLPRPTEWNDVVRLQVGSVTPCAIGIELKRRIARHYDAAVADLMLARRSSISSRSTSQYLSADKSSLSG